MKKPRIDLEEHARMYAEKCGHEFQRPALNLGRNLQIDEKFKHLVRKDLKDMDEKLPLDLVDDGFREALLVQSVLGHAQQGHGEYFYNNPFPQATIQDITHASPRGHRRIVSMRQQHIDRIHKWTDRAIEGKVHRFAIDGEPLLGVGFLRNHKINDMEAVLKGMVLAGYMDNYQSRMETLEHYNHRRIDGRTLEIGGGESFLVDTKLLLAKGYSTADLGAKAYNEGTIEYFRQLGIICETANSNVESTYIRRKEGAGTSDDLAFLMIGNLFGIDAMYGAFIVDAVDTYDKCVTYPQSGGIDEALGRFVEASFKFKTGEDIVSKEDIYKVIYFSAKNNTPKVAGSSSHRRLIEMQGDRKLMPVFLQHVAHLRGEKTAEFQVGFNGPQSPYFYQAANERAKYMLQERTR